MLCNNKAIQGSIANILTCDCQFLCDVQKILSGYEFVDFVSGTFFFDYVRVLFRYEMIFVQVYTILSYIVLLLVLIDTSIKYFGQIL